MKELTKEQVFEALETLYPEIAEGRTPEMIIDYTLGIINYFYRLGQQEAGIDEQRFRAACAAFPVYRSQMIEATPEAVAYLCRVDADALIAELNRTAGKGGEG